jgi:hypothetical protein
MEAAQQAKMQGAILEATLTVMKEAMMKSILDGRMRERGIMMEKKTEEKMDRRAEKKGVQTWKVLRVMKRL